MKPGLKIGDTGDLVWTVDSSMVILLGGDPRAAVFSTPNMILLMERAARESLRPYLEPGEESVGTEVQVQHIGGAGLGTIVRGKAHVRSVEGRKIQSPRAVHAGPFHQCRKGLAMGPRQRSGPGRITDKKRFPSRGAIIGQASRSPPRHEADRSPRQGSQSKIAYRNDTDAYIRCLQLDDAREGIQAFIEKRPARFSSK